ncbi:alpha/beta hydrolase [Piscinibacter gummiphilus]|uniref:Alpha/beta fold hydrolase n=1 Tax=Piscinibacter gummiphilus TaxID=946333 RepID=A0ABZ0CUP9_9BURK|nr:alpha/beta fold hydrolase [Piscinibacter gummiphilus]WOB08702.1 alpha/beta fold hydrolase [Piscinibacter gummiphilus]
MLTSLVVVALLAYGAACAALFFFQRSLLYFPQPAHVDTPHVPVDGRPGVVASHRALAGAQAVLYFGGNGEDVTQNFAPLAQAFPQHSLYLLHYRGYGRSSGKPTEADIADDALALFDQVHRQHPQVTVIGRSLGSGVATRLASQRPAARLVLVTPYDSIEDIAAARFRVFPVRWLLLDKYASWRYAAQVQAPTTVLMAEHDEVIPRDSTEMLMTRFAAGRATLHVLPGAGHNDISLAADYVRLLGGAR